MLSKERLEEIIDGVINDHPIPRANGLVLVTEIERLQTERAEMIRVLKYYGDELNYICQHEDDYEFTVESDNGKQARDLLKKMGVEI